MDQDNSAMDQQQEQQKPKNKNPFHAFIPSGDYFFTPIILSINVLIFVAMCISGVSPMLPDAVSLQKWGANYYGATMHGEPWRLFTSMFLHFGIIHLAANMYALYSLGRMLEPFIGKWRFLVLYLCAGLGGSAVSLWWHANDMSVSAGASGAIFGLFGVFAAILTTNLVEQSIRKQLLKSIGSAIVLNLLIGLYGGIDNAAHVGGLLTGAAGGYLSYFDLKSWYHFRIKKYTGLIMSGLLTAGLLASLYMIIPKDLPDPELQLDLLLKRYDSLENHSMNFLIKIDSTTTVDQIQKNAVQPLSGCLSVVDTILAYKITPEAKNYFNDMRIYTLFRLKAADEYKRAILEKRPELMDSAKVSMIKAGQVAEEMKKTMEDN